MDFVQLYILLQQFSSSEKENFQVQFVENYYDVTVIRIFTLANKKW